MANANNAKSTEPVFGAEWAKSVKDTFKNAQNKDHPDAFKGRDFSGPASENQKSLVADLGFLLIN
jgi:hypothetical protein